MEPIRTARAIAGLGAVLTLLGLLVAEFFMGRQLRPGAVQVLLLLIGALLGLDMVTKRLSLPITIRIDEGDSADDETK